MAARQPALSILHLASSLREWGGIERYVVYLAQGFAARGHRVSVACPPQSPIDERFGGCVGIEMRRKLDLRGFAAYLRLFRSNRYDVVHGHFSPDFTLPAYAARMTRQPLTVMTRHVAVPWHPAKARAYARLWNRIVPVSQAVERRLIESGIPASQMIVAKAGTPMPDVRVPRNDARAALGLSEFDFAVGSFGRLVPEKGVSVLIDAIGEVPGGRACVFGHGPEEAALRARASSAPTTFYGQIADVADAMAAMDVVAIPSTWEEPFPYVALEAMALARPLVASRIGGLPEMVEDGVNGLLVVPADSAALAVAFGSLAADPSLRAAMGSAGHTRYVREFTLDHMVERMLAVYMGVV